MVDNARLDRLPDIVARHKVTMFVGKTDTGKSTLIGRIAAEIGPYILDSDIGQSDIGPPSTVTLGRMAGDRYQAIDGYFCGSTSPAGHFMPLLAGTARMMRLARGHQVLINTTGLATGDIGRTLKTEKINAVRPDLIVAIATGNELKYLDAFARSGVEVVHTKPRPGVRAKSRSERADIRMASFRRHFEGAAATTHKLIDIGVERSILSNGSRVDQPALERFPVADILHAETLGGDALIVYYGKLSEPEKIASALGVDVIYAYRPGDFHNVLVGLTDNNGRLLALGMLEAIDFRAGTISVFSTAEDFSVLQFGSMKLDRTDFSSAGPFKPEVVRRPRPAVRP